MGKLLQLILGTGLFPIFLVLGIVLVLIALAALIVCAIVVIICFVVAILAYFPLLVKQAIFGEKII